MAIAYVGTNTQGEDISGGSITSIATSATMNVAAGNLIVVGVKHNSSVTVSSVTDGGSNSLTKAGTATNVAAGQSIDIWYKLNASANATATWTATAGSAPYLSIAALQFSGVATSNALDVAEFTGTADAAITVTSGSFTPAQTNEVAIAIAQENSNGSVWSTTSNYTPTTASGTGHQVYAQYDITISAGAQQVAVTNDTAQYKSLGVVTFKEASAGASHGSLTLLGVG